MRPVPRPCLKSRVMNLLAPRLKLLLLLLLLLLPSCSKDDDTEKIRSLIKKGAELAEKHDLGGLLELTTEDFLALPGKHGSREVRRILWFTFNHYGNFKVLYPEPSVDLEADGGIATARVYFLIVRREQSIPNLKELYQDPQDWLEEVGENADLYRLKLDLGKDNGDWLVRRALLEPFRGAGFSG
ncbi:MAG: hypothetical protein JSW13_06605 [Candidatus Aerophobus sp.]|nr:MAG: hypothetical protein JSW13_06605 [Candidatus Aerophobus sp.]